MRLPFSDIYDASSLILDVMESLVLQEKAECVMVVYETRTQILYDHNVSMALTLFKSSGIHGRMTAQVGGLCPFHIIHFQSEQLVSSFLQNNEDSIRKRDGRYIFIIEEVTNILSARQFFR